MSLLAYDIRLLVIALCCDERQQNLNLQIRTQTDENKEINDENSKNDERVEVAVIYYSFYFGASLLAQRQFGD